MRKIVLLFMFSYCIVSFSQTIADNQLLELPRNAEDFHKYQFDYNLESIIGIGTPYTNLMNSKLNILGHSPLEHNCPVKSISFTAYDSTVRFGEREMNKTPSLIIRIRFSDSGKMMEYHRGWESHVAILKNEIVPCVPNALVMDARATRTNGLITKVETLDDYIIEYAYDSNKRVSQATIRKFDKCIGAYQYIYNGGKNDIKTIMGYDGRGRITCDITYTYTNNKISSVSCITYGYTLDGQKYTGDKYSKSYRYDTHNNYSEITWVKTGSANSWLKQRLSCENSYDVQGRLSSSKISLYFSNDHQGREICNSHIRKFTYDDRGNWVKLEEDNGSIAFREIEY